MKDIVIISGSHRNGSQSRKVSNYVQNRCETIFDESPQIVDLASAGIPMWDEGVFGAGEPWASIWKPIADILSSSRGLIMVVPEWGGMVPPALINFLLLCTSKEVGHKPNLLIGISSSSGGAYPISELRSSGYKNNKICHIPEHVIIRNVESVLNTEAAENDVDEYIRDRLDWTLKIYARYVTALDMVREDSNLLMQRDYRNGM